MLTPLRIAVIGPGTAETPLLALAQAVGTGLTQASVAALCGGLGGVMEVAARGAQQAGEITVGLLPRSDAATANPSITLPIATSMGEARNSMLIHSPEAIIAIGGGWGMLSEVVVARRAESDVIGLHSWEPSGVVSLVEAAADAQDAVVRTRVATRHRRGSAGSAVYHINVSAKNL